MTHLTTDCIIATYCTLFQKSYCINMLPILHCPFFVEISGRTILVFQDGAQRRTKKYRFIHLHCEQHQLHQDDHQVQQKDHAEFLHAPRQ